jgi:uncharacterized repeat protein (TIGR03943 family)
MFVRQLFIFFGYGFFSLYLLFTGEVSRFIAPSLSWLIYFTGIALAVFVIILSTIQIGFKRETLLRDLAMGLILIYPIVLSVLFRPSDIKTVNLPVLKSLPVETTAKDYRDFGPLPVDKDGYVRLNLLELWLLAKNYPDVVHSNKFRTSGMVSAVGNDSLSIRRLFMTCCVADAMPVEIDLKGDKLNLAWVKEGDWIEVSGKAMVSKQEILMLADSVIPIHQPKEPYITRWGERPPFHY